jgi:hypothetical protein
MRTATLRNTLLAAAIVQALSMSARVEAGTPLNLVVTAAVDNGDPEQCGATSDVTALRGERVNLCYTVTNVGGDTFHFQTLVDSSAGRVLVHRAHSLAPGASYRFNRVVSAGQLDATYTAQWVASDILPGFDVAPADYDFVDISATGDVDQGLTFDMPFPIRFADDTDTQTMCLVDTGALQFFAGLQGPFGYCGIWTMHDNATLPVDFLEGSYDDSFDYSTRYPISWMPVFWDYIADFFLGADNGVMYRQVLGTAPTRRIVAQWKDFHHFDSDEFSEGSVTFEAIIEEETGRIVMQYQDTTFDDPAHPEWDHGGTAGVGWQYGMDVFDDYVNDDPVIASGTAIAWSPNAAVVARSNTAAATIHPGDARIDLEPKEISRTVAPGDVISADLAIANTGSLELDWSIDEGEGRALRALQPRPHWMPDRIASVPTSKPASRALASLRHVPSFPTMPLHSLAGASSPSAYAMSIAVVDGNAAYDYRLLHEIGDPTSGIEIANTGGSTWLAGGFVRNDFSLEYVITYPDGRLQTLDTSNGTIDDFGAITGAPQVVQWASLKWDAASDTVFAMGLDANGASYLYHLDIGSAHADLIGPIVSSVAAGTVITDVAIDADGAMYGIDIAYDGLFAIDKETGAATPIGALGFDANYVQAMDFDHGTGLLYLAGYDDFGGGGLYTIDTVSGAASLLGQFPGFVEYWSLAIASFKGACATPESVPWLSVTPASGTTAPGAASTANITVDTTGLANGRYDAAVCVRGSDPSAPGAAVPVRLSVISDPIFANGFDGN